jgi:hypothetical protein
MQEFSSAAGVKFDKNNIAGISEELQQVCRGLNIDPL